MQKVRPSIADVMHMRALMRAHSFFDTVYVHTAHCAHPTPHTTLTSASARISPASFRKILSPAVSARKDKDDSATPHDLDKNSGLQGTQDDQPHGREKGVLQDDMLLSYMACFMNRPALKGTQTTRLHSVI